MMGAEPGRPNELSPTTRIDTAQYAEQATRPLNAATRSAARPPQPVP